MPELKNAGWEAFAQGYARGLSQKAAYVAAGYSAGSNSAPTRLFKRDCVKERIAELVAQHERLREASLEETILAMLVLATKGNLETAAGAKEARTARLEAHRLRSQLTARREAEAWTPPREMTEAEWVAKYGADAPGSGL